MLAAGSGACDAVRLLVLSEASICDNVGDTALVYAARKGFRECMEALIGSEAGLSGEGRPTALMHVASYGMNVNQLSYLINKEQGRHDDLGMTALMYAVSAGQLAMAKLLAQHEVGLVDLQLRTALMHAIQRRKYAAAEYLLMAFPDTEACRQDAEGKTALMYLASEESVPEFLAALLIRKEAGLYDVDGKTALMYACLSNNAPLVRLLSRREAEKRTRDGKTALWYCMSGGKVWLYPYLLTELNIVSRNNPRQYLASRGAYLVDLVFLSGHKTMAIKLKDWLLIIMRAFCSAPKDEAYDLLEIMIDFYFTFYPTTSIEGELLQMLLHFEKRLDAALGVDDAPTCNICLDNIASVVTLPCCHCVTCRDCSASLRSQGKAFCIVCKAPTTDWIDTAE